MIILIKSKLQIGLCLKTILISIILLNVFTSFTSYSEAIPELNIYVGQSIDLDGYLVREGKIINTATVNYTVGDSQVINVNSSGTISGKKEGRTFITANILSGEKSSTINIIVNVKSTVEALEFTDKSVSLITGSTYTPEYTLLPKYEDVGVINNTIRLKSSDDKIAVVQGNTIRAVSEGDAIIYGYSEDGNRVSYFNIRVTDKYKKIKIVNLEHLSTIYVGEKKDVIVNDEFNSRIEGGLIYSTTNGSILSVGSNGEISGVSDGIATVVVKSDNGHETKVTLKVVSLIDHIEISPKSSTLTSLNETVKLEAKIFNRFSDIEPFDKKLYWYSSNSSIASVNNGIITALKSGIVRITAKTADGGFEDSVSIEVKLNDSVPNILVSDIKVDTEKDEYIVGEEIPLDITVYPLTATNKIVNCNITPSANGQVYSKNGTYYIKLFKEGNYTVKVASANGISSTKRIHALDTLNDIKIESDKIDQTSLRYQMYVGQNGDFTVNYITKKEYNQDDIFEKIYNVSINNSNIKVKEKNDTSFTLTGVSVGKSTITVKTAYTGKTDTIRIDILPIIKSIKAPEELEASVGENVKPDLDIMIVNNQYDIKEIDDPKLTYTIIKSYVYRGYLGSEIDYEKNSIEEMKNLVKEDSIKYYYLMDEIKRKQERLSILQVYYNQGREYVEILPKTKLTDRLGKEIIIAGYGSNGFTGYVRGMIKYQISESQGIKSNIGIIYFNSQLDALLIKSGEEVIGLSQGGLLEDKDVLLNSKTEALIVERFGNNLDADIPDKDYILNIIEFERKINLPELLKQDYRRNLTREDGVSFILSLYEYISGSKIKEVPNKYFKDDTTGISSKGYNLGILSPRNDRLFRPNELLTMEEFSMMLERTIKALQIKQIEYKDKISLTKTNEQESIGITGDNTLAINREAYLKYTRDFKVLWLDGNPVKPYKILKLQELLSMMNESIN